MRLFWKSKTVPVNNNTKEITIPQLWIVRWQARYGTYSGDTREEVEAFTSAELANDFAESLRLAYKLLKHTSGTSVTVGKN